MAKTTITKTKQGDWRAIMAGNARHFSTREEAERWVAQMQRAIPLSSRGNNDEKTKATRWGNRVERLRLVPADN